jgi:uncharacterized membrane protein
MKKLLSLLLFLPLFFAVSAPALASGGIDTFEARVVKIVDQREVTTENGAKIVQQDLVMRGLSGQWKDKEFSYYGIGQLDVLSGQVYKEGDEVLAQRTIGPGGEEFFSPSEYLRRDWLYLLAALFALVVAVVGGWKGLRSLVALAASFFLILKFILPAILAGYSPFLVSLVGGLVILAFIIYLTEGFNRKSNLAMASVFFSLLITLGLTVLFTWLTRLSGLDEDAGFLIGMTTNQIDFRGLLLAGFLIGAIGVLDDVVIGQVEAVEQLKKANPFMSSWDLFKSGYKIGNTHLGAIVNTLFLTYAGASLPLLLIFSLQSGTAITLPGAINNELIATEIVRTLVGSIGVALSMPIATALAAKWLKVKNKV